MIKWTAVILALVLVIGGILAAISLAYRALEISRQFQPAQLVQLTKASVNEITLIQRGQPTIHVFRRPDGQWFMDSPIHGLADTANTLITRETLFEMQVHRRYLAKDADRPDDEATGAAQPRVIVRLGSETGETMEFSILNFVPRRKETYVAVAGSDELLTVSPDPTGIIAKHFGHYRDVKLLDLSSEDVTKVDEIVARGRCNYQLVRHDNAWHFSGTDESVADYQARSDAVTGLLNSLASIELCGFLSEPVTDPARFSLDQPWQYYRLNFARETGRAPLELALVIHAGGMFASIDREMWPVQVRPEDGRAAIREVSELMDHRLFNFQAGDITYVEINSTGGSAAFTRTDEGWKSAGGAIDAQRFDRVLQGLTQLRFESVIADYATLTGFGLEHPNLETRVELADGREMIVQAGSNSPTAGRVYVKTSARRSVFTVNGDIISQLAALAQETQP